MLYDAWQRRQFPTNQRPRNYLRYTHTHRIDILSGPALRAAPAKKSLTQSHAGEGYAKDMESPHSTFAPLSQTPKPQSDKLPLPFPQICILSFLVISLSKVIWKYLTLGPSTFNYCQAQPSPSPAGLSSYIFTKLPAPTPPKPSPGTSQMFNFN